METRANIRKQIGEIGVDAGLCWIGDPCYILHADPAPKAIGRDWDAFCDLLHEGGQYPTCKQFHYDLGHPGLGVVVSTGYGDGTYPVFAEFNEDGRVAKVWVEFIGQDGETDEA
ncbi:MAG: DUF4241 domain-containing protein [Gemmatimonadales bacterium]|jgi:hypothetical protein|nr:DUF4241 domain-containing protein [Gemmatimonadales bacterium]